MPEEFILGLSASATARRTGSARARVGPPVRRRLDLAGIWVDLSESSERRGRSQESDDDDVEERDKRDEERDSESESESRSRGRLSEGSKDLGFRVRRLLMDLGLGFLEASGFVFWSFFRPRNSLQRLEHFGAFGDETEGSDAAAISDLIVGLSRSGDLTSGGGRDDVGRRGTSFPSEKSSSAVSIGTGSSSLNSKSIRSLADSSWSAPGSDFFGFEVVGSGFGLSSWLKELRGLKRLKAEGSAGELFTQAEAIGEHEKVSKMSSPFSGLANR